MSPSILVEFDAGIAIVTLNKEKVLNALNGDDFWALGSALEDIAEKDDIFLTLVIGNGRFFSAGADLSSMRTSSGSKEEMRKYWMEHLASHNLRNARSFYQHPKILVTALNGPVIGYPAALVAYSDFVYAAESSYLSTPFSSLGLVSEGVSSLGLVHRMGIAKANDALIRGKRISSQELLNCGFVNDILRPQGGQSFRESSLLKIREDFGDNLDKGAMLQTKTLIRRPFLRALDEQGVEEAFVGWRRFVQNLPQQHFQRFMKSKKGSRL